ncbi:porin [Paraburkholderia sp. A2WS-5]|uniref:porin n=1 Tax=unclassified Paraburkholderia TaxID=2615204 RepID=UPI003B7FAB6E
MALGPGFFNGSRLGLFGTEDLGGGMSAIFRIEADFNPTTRVSLQGNREFGRQAYVGIKSGYGQVTLGRQYSIPFETLLPYDTIGWANSPRPMSGFSCSRARAWITPRCIRRPPPLREKRRPPSIRRKQTRYALRENLRAVVLLGHAG